MNKKSLRKKLIEILKDADHESIGQDVFGQRSVPTKIDALPVVLIYSKVTSVDQRDEAPKSYLKNVDVVFEIVTQHSDDEALEDEMDDLSEWLIKTIEDNFYLEENCEYVTLKAENDDTEGNGESPAGTARITYAFGLNFNPRQDLVFDDLKELDNNFQMNDNGNNDARDILELPQE